MPPTGGGGLGVAIAPSVDGVVHYRSEVSEGASSPSRCLPSASENITTLSSSLGMIVELARDEWQLERWEVVAYEIDELDRVLDLVVER